jgi:ABC-2 type transport system permease protein
MPLLTITRKQLADSRWSLLFSCLAFYGLAILWNWGISVNQFPPPEPDLREEARADGKEEDEPKAEDGGAEGPEAIAAVEKKEEEAPRRGPGRRRGLGVYQAFGVPMGLLFDEESPPTLAMQAAFANHPLITLALIGWAIARGSIAVAGEIERGSLDWTLSRPVYRSTYLAAQILSTVLVLVLLSGTIVLGHLTAPFFFSFKNLPSVTGYLPSTLMVIGFALAIYGYTLAISAADLSRVRVGILGLGITLAGIAGIVFARQYEDIYKWAENLSVFTFYWPVGITVEWTREMTERLLVLYGVFAAGAAVAFAFFLRRDLPTSGG